MLEIVSLILGPLETNTYLIGDSDTHEAAVIDPAWDGEAIAAGAVERDWRIGQIWITHAHFDHIGGIRELAGALNGAPLIGLHPQDRPLWNNQGGAAGFGVSLAGLPSPSLALADGMLLQLGHSTFKVAHTPGHTPGHCVFYNEDEAVCFCGDLIFQNSIGRTDLPGGDWNMLMDSIQMKVFSLPDETRLWPGHGPGTSVGVEKRSNPFFGHSGK